MKSLELNSYLHKLCVLVALFFYSKPTMHIAPITDRFFDQKSRICSMHRKKSIHFLMFYQLENKDRQSDKIDASNELLRNIKR